MYERGGRKRGEVFETDDFVFDFRRRVATALRASPSRGEKERRGRTVMVAVVVGAIMTVSPCEQIDSS